jgi:hypothetical protein
VGPRGGAVDEPERLSDHEGIDEPEPRTSPRNHGDSVRGRILVRARVRGEGELKPRPPGKPPQSRDHEMSLEF